MIDAPEKAAKKLTGLDAIAALEAKAAEPTPAEVKEAQEAEANEEIAAFEYQEQEVVLPAGWHMSAWKQKHLMGIHEAGAISKALNGGYDNRWRRNYEVVRSVFENGGFDVKGIQIDDIDDMDWRDVEMICLAAIAHYQNTILIKKK